MKTERLSEGDALELLKDRIVFAGGQARFAQSNGINQSYVSMALSGRQDLGPKILKILGLKKIIEFEREVSE